MSFQDTCDVESLFERKFTFQKNDDWFLPPVCHLLEELPWKIDSLQNLKLEVNATKSLLNDKGQEWHKHTHSINKSGLVIDFVRKIAKPEILTQAWCKFYEILSSYDLLPVCSETFCSFHICEAPGAFVSALNYYICLNHPMLNWKWFANTLNPYYEGHSPKKVVVDDRLLLPTLSNWHFGKNNTGDVMDNEYLPDVNMFLKSEGPVHLVTADGSFNCLENPGEQELLVAELQLTEVIIALSNIAPSGCFVLKKFTFFESITVCTMYLLNCAFEKVHVFKPATSKAGNSEVYVICLRYLGVEKLMPYLEKLNSIFTMKDTKAVFPLSSLPESFIMQIEQCARMFAEFQMSSIKENIHLFNYMSLEDQELLNEIRERCANRYLQKYAIVAIEDEFYFKLFHVKKKAVTTLFGNQKTDLRSLYFQAMGETFENLEQSKNMHWNRLLTDVQNRMNVCFPVNRKRNIDDDDKKWHYVWKEIPRRMKSKIYKNWITFGKKIYPIQNSKFCNPLLLYLWNKISYNPQVYPSNHCLTSHCHWDWTMLANLMSEIKLPETSYILVVQPNTPENDPILWGLKQALDGNLTVYNLAVESDQIPKCPKFQKIVVINTLKCFENCLHQEMLIKNQLVEFLHSAIKVLRNGDIMIICVQSLFTRYIVGVFFMVLSLFSKFFTLLPSFSVPAEGGQLWIFADFQNPNWTSRLLDYLEVILDLTVPETSEVLELVPITSLCGNQYYDYILNCNNIHLLQRLQNFISVEYAKMNK